jgi:hypothetical protein
MHLSPFLLAGILALTPAASQAAGLNPFGTSRGWANPASGNSGTITLIDRFETDFQGTKLPCRKLRYHVTIRNRSGPYNLLIDRCRIADGSRKLF